MDEIAANLAEFRRALRLEGFGELESMQLTTAYLVELMRGARELDCQVVPS